MLARQRRARPGVDSVGNLREERARRLVSREGIDAASRGGARRLRDGAPVPHEESIRRPIDDSYWGIESVRARMGEVP
jgi:hypothetical protein